MSQRESPEDLRGSGPGFAFTPSSFYLHLTRRPAALVGRLIRIVHTLPMNEISGSGNSISQVHFPEETIRFRKTVRRPAPMRVEVRAGQNCALPTSGRTMEAATAKEVMIT